MNNTNGNMYQRTISKAFQIDSVTDLLKIGFLLSLGFAAVFLRTRLNYSLKMPGHHGVEFMLLFMAGRTLTKHRHGMSISSIGASASAFLPFFHFGNGFMPLTFLLPGIIGDIIINRSGKVNLLYAALAGGLAYSSIPITKQLIMLGTGFPFPSLFAGLWYPFAMHFMFGAIGSAAGAAIFRKFSD